MTKQNKNNYLTIFHLIADLIKRADVSCVLIGGFAVNSYHVTRQTADIDLMITKDDFSKILVLLKEAGYKEDFVQEVFVRMKGGRAFLMDLDFMFVDKNTLEKIAKDSRTIVIAGQKFIVPSLNNLIALKLHSIKFNPEVRENKDLPDIINLIKLNRVNFGSKKFKELCLKFGPKKIYSKIIRAVSTEL